MNVLFITSVAVIAADPPESRKLCVDALGLPLEGQTDDGYYSSGKIGGSKHFGVWPLSEAAEACFGAKEWPADRPAPQVSLEFEAEDPAAVKAAAKEPEAKGFSLLHPVREEPWGGKPSRGCSQLRARSSGSPTRRRCTTDQASNRGQPKDLAWTANWRSLSTISTAVAVSTTSGRPTAWTAGATWNPARGDCCRGWLGRWLPNRCWS